ncbi:MAG: hypothetical protein U0559_09410 [Anaerolineae bacterium]
MSIWTLTSWPRHSPGASKKTFVGASATAPIAFVLIFDQHFHHPILIAMIDDAGNALVLIVEDAREALLFLFAHVVAGLRAATVPGRVEYLARCATSSLSSSADRTSPGTALRFRPEGKPM